MMMNITTSFPIRSRTRAEQKVRVKRDFGDAVKCYVAHVVSNVGFHFL
jgi:hypothetical protein